MCPQTGRSAGLIFTLTAGELLAAFVMLHLYVRVEFPLVCGFVFTCTAGISDSIVPYVHRDYRSTSPLHAQTLYIGKSFVLYSQRLQEFMKRLREQQAHLLAKAKIKWVAAV